MILFDNIKDKIKCIGFKGLIVNDVNYFNFNNFKFTKFFGLNQKVLLLFSNFLMTPKKHQIFKILPSSEQTYIIANKSLTHA